jgi:AraC family transcriptional regulator, arabinose operon regulatory protein
MYRKRGESEAAVSLLTAKSCTPTEAGDARIQRALQLMLQSQIIEPGNIAAILNLSVSRFRHLFKREMGISFNQYQKTMRLEQARELLENSFLRIKEITAKVGIGDVSHFTRDYKARYGRPPSQTRVRMRRNDSHNR